MIGRRAALLLASGVAARRVAAALPVPARGELEFSMMRHGSEIGRHNVAFEGRGEDLTVHITVDARVTLLSIPIARYRHRVVETWKGDELVGLVGRTDKNGRQEWVEAHRRAEGLEVLGSGTGRYVAPPNAMAITYWNRHMLDGPMIDAESGELQRPKIVLQRAEIVPLASGEEIVADHYNLSGAVRSDVWYDRSGAWASLVLGLVDGSTLYYRRL